MQAVKLHWDPAHRKKVLEHKRMKFSDENDDSFVLANYIYSEFTTGPRAVLLTLLGISPPLWNTEASMPMYKEGADKPSFLVREHFDHFI